MPVPSEVLPNLCRPCLPPKKNIRSKGLLQCKNWSLQLVTFLRIAPKIVSNNEGGRNGKIRRRLLDCYRRFSESLQRPDTNHLDHSESPTLSSSSRHGHHSMNKNHHHHQLQQKPHQDNHNRNPNYDHNKSYSSSPVVLRTIARPASPFVVLIVRLYLFCGIHNRRNPTLRNVSYPNHELHRRLELSLKP